MARILMVLAVVFITSACLYAQSTGLLEAVEEFRRQTAPLSEGGSLNVQARKPRPVWHGRLYENFRNNALDAIPHQVRQRGQPKPKLRRNQFGVNVTGPVYIPKLYNGSGKTFFTLSFEGMREIIGQSRLATIPTTLGRTGDFSKIVDIAGNPLPIYDPNTTYKNPNYNPALPVTADNLVYERSQFVDNKIPVNRLDPVAMAAMPYYPQPNISVGPFFRNNYFIVSNQVNKATGFILTVDHTFLQKNRVTVRLNRSTGQNGNAPLFLTPANPQNPNALVGSRGFRVEHIYTASATNINTFSIQANSQTSHNDTHYLPDGSVFPNYQIQGFLNMGAQNPIGQMAQNVYQVQDTFATRKSSHRISLTAQLQESRINVYRPFSIAGRYNFDSQYTSLPGVINTGYSMASFLLGAPSQAQKTITQGPSYFRWFQQRYLFNDQWQVTPSLTVTMGANWEIYGRRTEKYNRQSNIDLSAINPANGRPGALVVAGYNGTPRTFAPTWDKVEPQLGIAYSVLGDNDTVLRLNYQRRYSGPPNTPFQFATQAFNGTLNFVSPNRQVEPALLLRDGIPHTRTFPDFNGDAANGTNANIYDTSNRQPTTTTFQASIQRQLAPFLILTVTGRYRYARNQMVGSNAANPNAVPINDLVYRDQLNDLTFRNQLRPYPQYQDFQVARFWPVGASKSKRLSIRLEKRTSGGLALSAQYNYNWAIDQMGNGIQNYYNLNAEWARSSVNPHSLNLTYIYELPFGPGQKFFNGNGVFNRFFGGWAISGNTNFWSGQPLTMYAQFNNTGTVVPNLRASLVPGVSPFVKNQGPSQWFNQAAFVQPDNFQVGNTPRTIPGLLGPGGYNHDITMNKRFTLSSEQTLEFTASLFNATNHANWNQPDTRIGPANAPNANGGRIIGSTGGRIVQLGLRLNF